MEVEFYQIVDGDVVDYVNFYRYFCRQCWDVWEEKVYNDDGNQWYVVNVVELFYLVIQFLWCVGDLWCDQY